jgi:hypothetical protein
MDREGQEFKALIRVLYKFIRAFHHVMEMKVASDSNCPPARFQRMARQISAGIQPAFPKCEHGMVDFWQCH